MATDGGRRTRRSSVDAGRAAAAPTAATLATPHGDLPLPAFLPDATIGVVRAVDTVDVLQAGVQALVMNTFHLMQRPGSSTVQALGGLHTMAAWPKTIVTDSGGFQAYSLIRQNPKFGTLTDNGILFRPEGSDRKLQLTPEKCIQLQMAYGADVIMCLDDCTHVDEAPDQQEVAVRRTIAWAKRCRAEYDALLARRRDAPRGLPPRPLLFGIVQGGGVPELRQMCAEALLEIGFDGYGYGGWPLDAQGNLLADLLAYTRSLIPSNYPMHALGVGHPASIVACADLGYSIFDSALPTRDGRQARLYRFTTATPAPRLGDTSWLGFLYLQDDKYIKDRRPVEEGCDCLACRHYSRGYLHHLYKSGDVAFQRLGTIHNLRFMARLMAALQGEAR